MPIKSQFYKSNIPFAAWKKLSLNGYTFYRVQYSKGLMDVNIRNGHVT